MFCDGYLMYLNSHIISLYNSFYWYLRSLPFPLWFCIYRELYSSYTCSFIKNESTKQEKQPSWWFFCQWISLKSVSEWWKNWTCSLTSLVELEAGQRGVDAHRDWTHFKQSDSQRSLVAHGNLLVAFALGCHAWWIVAARLVLNTNKKKLFHISVSVWKRKLKLKEAICMFTTTNSSTLNITNSTPRNPLMLHPYTAWSWSQPWMSVTTTVLTLTLSLNPICQPVSHAHFTWGSDHSLGTFPVSKLADSWQTLIINTQLYFLLAPIDN